MLGLDGNDSMFGDEGFDNLDGGAGFDDLCHGGDHHQLRGVLIASTAASRVLEEVAVLAASLDGELQLRSDLLESPGPPRDFTASNGSRAPELKPQTAARGVRLAARWTRLKVPSTGPSCGARSSRPSCGHRVTGGGSVACCAQPTALRTRAPS